IVPSKEARFCSLAIFWKESSVERATSLKLSSDEKYSNSSSIVGGFDFPRSMTMGAGSSTFCGGAQLRENGNNVRAYFFIAANHDIYFITICAFENRYQRISIKILYITGRDDGLFPLFKIFSYFFFLFVFAKFSYSFLRFIDLNRCSHLLHDHAFVVTDISAFDTIEIGAKLPAS